MTFEGDCCWNCPYPDEHKRKEKDCQISPGEFRGSGESWLKTPCERCVCINGKTNCKSKTCPPVNCHTPVVTKNSCCPICIGKWKFKPFYGFLVLLWTFFWSDFLPPDSCFDQQTNTERLAGSIWRRDICTECTCIEGEIFCFTEACKIISKEDCNGGHEPIQAEGYCCKVCPMMPVFELGHSKETVSSST